MTEQEIVFFLSGGVLSIFAAGIGAYVKHLFTSWAKKDSLETELYIQKAVKNASTEAIEKAKIATIARNLEEIKAQQKELARATEEVKKDIELQVWRKQEIELARRERLEETAALLCKMRELIVELVDAARTNNYGNFEKKDLEFVRTVHRLIILRDLYFSQFNIGVSCIVKDTRAYRSFAHELLGRKNEPRDLITGLEENGNKLQSSIDVLWSQVVITAKELNLQSNPHLVERSVEECEAVLS